jgi:hypothetical protein
MLGPMTDAAPDQPAVTKAQTDGLPGPIADDLLEAALCCSVGAYRGAALLARRAVEQVAVMRRIPLEMRTLHQKLLWLLRAGHLPAALAPQAVTVRDIGNAAAHGGEPLTRDETYAMVGAALAVARGVLLN